MYMYLPLYGLFVWKCTMCIVLIDSVCFMYNVYSLYLYLPVPSGASGTALQCFHPPRHGEGSGEVRPENGARDGEEVCAYKVLPQGWPPGLTRSSGSHVHMYLGIHTHRASWKIVLHRACSRSKSSCSLLPSFVDQSQCCHVSSTFTSTFCMFLSC